MQDGKNLFFPEEAFAGSEWQVDETMDRLDQMNAVRSKHPVRTIFRERAVVPSFAV